MYIMFTMFICLLFAFLLTLYPLNVFWLQVPSFFSSFLPYFFFPVSVSLNLLWRVTTLPLLTENFCLSLFSSPGSAAGCAWDKMPHRGRQMGEQQKALKGRKNCSPKMEEEELSWRERTDHHHHARGGALWLLAAAL